MKTIAQWVFAAMAACVASVVTLPAYADVFRTADGKVVASGLSRAKVLALLGEPQSRHVESLGVSTGTAQGTEPEEGRTVETWTYFTKGPVGNDVLLTITMEAAKVTKVQVENPQ